MSYLPQTTSPTRTLTSAHLRAFIYGDSMKPGRPAILRHSAEEIAQAMIRLPAEDAARGLALLPAGVQIPVVARLNASTRARASSRIARTGPGPFPSCGRITTLLQSTASQGR
ncbi:hypothetical protein [Natronohydrobacter thiooxidans]|uniref:hypothetical protein n=1 Tax=Natronohydrobacter thiooxidans TaxID=87172 RepID=UPI0008FF1045|nr:hypothetical protein [Natronohydrobacter thiooxidans]